MQSAPHRPAMPWLLVGLTYAFMFGAAWWVVLPR
jgi:hypothetical protein